MDDGKHRADHQREDRDCLGTSGDRAAPLRVHQPKDGRDERAGMADADPKDEVGDVEGPKNRPADSSHAEATVHLIQQESQPPQTPGKSKTARTRGPRPPAPRKMPRARRTEPMCGASAGANPR